MKVRPAWDRDRRPMGPPEAAMASPGEVTLTLLIPEPFGPGTDALLAIRAIDTEAPGGVITSAITVMRRRRR